MYVVDAMRLLMRRWYVALIGLLLIAGGAAFTLSSVPTQYQASGQMLFLLPPDSTGAKTPSNPYINLVPGLTTTASLLASEAMTKDVSQTLAKDGYKSEYSVALVPSTGPLLTISTKDTNPAQAVAMRDAVMKWVRGRLSQIQNAVSVPDSQFIYTENTNVGSQAEVLPGSKIRALAGVGGAGMVLTLLSAFALDRLLTRRRAAAERRRGTVEAETVREPLSDEEPTGAPPSAPRPTRGPPRAPEPAGEPPRAPEPAREPPRAPAGRGEPARAREAVREPASSPNGKVEPSRSPEQPRGNPPRRPGKGQPRGTTGRGRGSGSRAPGGRGAEPQGPEPQGADSKDAETRDGRGAQRPEGPPARPWPGGAKRT